jgi:hypothetical protein
MISRYNVSSIQLCRHLSRGSNECLFCTEVFVIVDKPLGAQTQRSFLTYFYRIDLTELVCSVKCTIHRETWVVTTLVITIVSCTFKAVHKIWYTGTKMTCPVVIHLFRCKKLHNAIHVGVVFITIFCYMAGTVILLMSMAHCLSVGQVWPNLGITWLATNSIINVSCPWWSAQLQAEFHSPVVFGTWGFYQDSLQQ